MQFASVLSSALFLGWLSMANAQTADGLVMNTPMALTTCQNASLTWANAPAGPVFVSVVPGGQPSAAPLVQFNTTDGSTGQITWLVDQPADTSVTVLITDSTGKSTGSAAVTIKKGVDESCVGKGQSVHPSTSAATSSQSTSSASAGSASGSKGPSTSSNKGSSTSGTGASNTSDPATQSPSASGSSTSAPTSSTSTSTPSTDPATHTSTSTTSSNPKNYTTVEPSATTTSSKTDATDSAIALQHQMVFCAAVMVVSAILITI